MSDPFRHHPNLRALIKPPRTSMFYDATIEKFQAIQLGIDGDTSIFLADDVREDCRLNALRGKCDQDLWVFGYGSLIWDPGFDFTEVRRAHAPDVERRFILRDIYGGRGDRERPGVMAALDYGSGCDGVVFRIARDKIDTETRRIWIRERAVAAYQPAFIKVDTDQGPVQAVTFVADHDASLIQADLDHADQVRFCATGTGFFGSSLEYVENLATHFATFDIVDPTVTRLLADARAYRLHT